MSKSSKKPPTKAKKPKIPAAKLPAKPALDAVPVQSNFAPLLKVETWEIGKVLPYSKNPRLIPEKAVDKVAASIREYGWRQPIVVDKDGVVIVGHTRLKAALKLGLPEVPIHVANLTDAQARAYRLADNRTNQEASWIDEILAGELDALKDMDFDLGLTGFDD